MTTSEEVRLMRAVVDEFLPHIGVTDVVAYTRTLHACLPHEGYRGAKKIDEALRDVFERLLLAVDAGKDIRSPANWVLKVWSDLVRGVDPKPKQQSNGPDSADTFADLAREIEDGDRRLFADEGRNRRVKAIEEWRRRRNRDDGGPEVPSPNWALQGFDSPEEYQRALQAKPGSQLRAMRAQRPKATPPKPKRGETGTLFDSIKGSEELRNQADLNADE